jgi:hypothetical protein
MYAITSLNHTKVVCCPTSSLSLSSASIRLLHLDFFRFARIFVIVGKNFLDSCNSAHLIEDMAKAIGTTYHCDGVASPTLCLFAVDGCWLPWMAACYPCTSVTLGRRVYSVFSLAIAALKHLSSVVSALRASTVHRQCIASVPQGVRLVINFGYWFLILPVARSAVPSSPSDHLLPLPRHTTLVSRHDDTSNDSNMPITRQKGFCLRVLARLGDCTP